MASSRLQFAPFSSMDTKLAFNQLFLCDFSGFITKRHKVHPTKTGIFIYVWSFCESNNYFQEWCDSSEGLKLHKFFSVKMVIFNLSSLSIKLLAIEGNPYIVTCGAKLIYIFILCYWNSTWYIKKPASFPFFTYSNIGILKTTYRAIPFW